MKRIAIYFIILITFVLLKNNFGQTDADYLYYKNFVRHSSGELCEHIPPATSFTAYLNGDEDRILLENAPRWSTGGEPNIAGNGTFGVELGNFANPPVVVSDSVFIRFTCNTAGEQATLRSKVEGIPWYYFPKNLYLNPINLPGPPQNVTLSADTSTFYRTVTWTAGTGFSYDVYRRTYSDTLSDGRARMVYHRVGTGVTGGTFIDYTTMANEKYGYVVYAINPDGVKSSHSEEVNEDPYIRPGMDLTIKYVARLPRIDYVWGSSNPAVEGWPAVNDPVTWRVVVKNWSDSSLSAVSYTWIIDSAVVDTGFIPIAGEDTAFVDFAWNWTFDRHVIAFVIDPRKEVPEEEEANNRIEVFTDAIAVGFYVEQSLYDYFHQFQKNLGVGSNCWEDWAHRHIRMWNQMFASATYPDNPDGVLDRIRLDKIHVVPDGALPLAGGLPTNNPNLNDRTIDLQWGFPATLLNGNFYANHTAAISTNPFYFEGSLLHELGHARYLIDLYGFNVHDDGTGNTVDIRENGRLIVGTPFMPLSGDAVHWNPIKGLMNGEYTWVDEYSTGALNRIAGHRATLGNYNAPGNIGEFLQDLPFENRILVKDKQGNILPQANIKIYRAAPQAGVWYGKYYDNTADDETSADNNGYAYLGRCPFAADGVLRHTYGHSNGVLIMRVQYGSKIGYTFLEVTEFNMEYWRGNTTEGNYEISVELLEPTAINNQVDEQLAGDFDLKQNYPNPFNPETMISYYLPVQARVSLVIYNTLGEIVETLVGDEKLPAGHYSLTWNSLKSPGSNASGIYYCRLTADSYQKTIKMLLLK